MGIQQVLVESITQINLRTGRRLYRKEGIEPSERVTQHGANKVVTLAADLPTLLCNNQSRANVSLANQRHVLKTVSGKDSLDWQTYGGLAGSIGEIDKAAQCTGLDYHRWSIFTGVERIFSNAKLGLLLEYGSIYGKWDHNWGRTHVDQVHSSLYGRISLPSCPQAFVYAILGSSYDNYTFLRNQGGSVSKGSSKGYEYDALLGAEYSFFAQQRVCFTPVAYVQYVYERIGGYCERGAGEFNSSVGNQQLSSLASFVGVRVGPHYKRRSWRLAIELDLLWQHELFNRSYDLAFVPLSPENAVNSVQMISVGSDLFIGGAGVIWEYRQRWYFNLSYDLKVNTRTMSQSAQFGGGIRF